MAKTVLVTGGSGEIGSAISKQFAALGFSVIITYNSNEEKANRLLAELGDGHSAYQAANTDPIAIQKLYQIIKEKYGRLDVLVNNAGITTPVAHDDLDSLTDEWIDRILSTNFKGSFAMIRAMKELLLKASKTSNEPSLVVNISSIAGQFGIGSNVAYCASKAALDCMTKSLGRALAPDIRVLSVSPGWVLGDYTKNIDPAYIEKQKSATPLDKLAVAEDVANAVTAAYSHLTFSTGSIISVDGGRVLGS